MRRRQIFALTTGTIVLVAGCIGSPSEENESPSEWTIFLEVRRVDKTEEDARIADYECVSQSPILKEALDGTREDESATTRISNTERENISETLNSCYDTETGATYVQKDDDIFKISFLKQQ